MPFDPSIHHRHSIRVKEFDYASTGVYFITVCTHQRECLFGEIENGEMNLNEVGKIVQEELLKTSVIRKEVELDEWIIMPNHLHFLIWFQSSNLVGAHSMRPDPDSQSHCHVNESDRQCADATDGINIHHAGASFAPLRRRARSVGSMVAGFKSAVTRELRSRLNIDGSAWQRNYYERVIRSEEELNRIRQYIRDNPLKWDSDPERPV